MDIKRNINRLTKYSISILRCIFMIIECIRFVIMSSNMAICGYSSTRKTRDKFQWESRKTRQKRRFSLTLPLKNENEMDKMKTEKNMKNPDVEIIVHNGISCPKKSPWPKKSAIITFIPWPFIVLMAVYILAKTSILMLGVWSAAFLLFAIPLRYLICAPCPYYGQSCSTIMGKVVPFVFKNRPGTPLALGLWLDIVSFTVLLIIPIPYAWNIGGVGLTAAWVGVFLIFLFALPIYGCHYCPFTYCPIGKAGRGLARWFHGTT